MLNRFSLEIVVPTLTSNPNSDSTFRTPVTSEAEHQKNDAKLMAIQKQFLAAMAFVSEGIVCHDAQGQVVYCNPAAERILGLSADHLMGKAPVAPDWFSTNEDGSPLICEDHPAMVTLRTGHPVRNFVIGVDSRDRARRWISVNTDPVYGESAELAFVVSCFSDVTEQREQSRSLDVIVDACKLGTWDWHIPSGRVKYNQYWANMLGYELSEIEPSIEVWGPLMAPATRAQACQQFQDNLEGRSDEYRCEMQLFHRDGTYRWVLAVGRVVARDINNYPQRMVGINIDISESKRIEAELKTLTGRYEASISGSSDGLWDRDFESEYEWYSERFWTLLGYPARGPFPSNEHQSFLDHLHPEDIEDTRNAVQKSRLEGTYYHHQYRLRLLDGKYRWFLSRGNVQRNDQGKVVRMSGTLSDIHELKTAEIALLEANEAAMAANVAKSEFLANMSHEIRTPMTAILGFSELLAIEERDTSNSDQKLEYINTIQRNGEHLLELINDILDISKIEAEKVSLEQLVFPLPEFLQEIVTTLKVKSKHKGIEFNLEIGSDLPATIQSDPLRLRQVLVNLIGNAIKFTERGSVTVRAHLDNNRECLLIDIVDTGIGLTAKQLEKLFGAFEQADASTTRKYGGTGLGLRISKRLAELIGGEISIASEFGRGSTFTLHLKKSSYEVPTLEAYKTNSQDIKPSTIRKSLPPIENPLTGLHILLAEDGPDNQRLIGHILRKAGASVEVAENGKVAIGRLTRNGTLDGELLSPLPFHLIISDINMPEIDGYSLARILQAKGLRLPIIALTADAMSDERQKCLNAGFSSYATKPIDKDSLIAVCLELGARTNNSCDIGNPKH